MMEIVQLSNKEAIQFKEALDKLCGEANEAARLSSILFKGDESKVVRRELARLMEVVESRIIPVYRKQFPSGLDNEP